MNQYHTYKKKKEKINLSPLYCGYHSWLKKFVDGSNLIAKWCKTILKEVAWIARAMPWKNKPNKTQWCEYSSIFNQSILFNSRINFILKK
jgi:hypothetical protein